MAEANTMEPIVTRRTIPAGTFIQSVVQERVKAAGTVQEVRVRFYSGQERELRVRPYILHKGDRVEELVTYPAGSDGYLSGEDDYLVIPVIKSVDYDDFICVDVENASNLYDYTLAIDIIVDYFGGKNRVSGGMIL